MFKPAYYVDITVLNDYICLCQFFSDGSWHMDIVAQCLASVVIPAIKDLVLSLSPQ